jgi:hypothetical protein
MRIMRSDTTRVGLMVAVLGGVFGTIIACGGTPRSEPAIGTTDEAPAGEPVAAAPAEAPPAEAGEPTKMSAADCDTLLHDAQAAMDAEHIKVDKPCKKDADCVGVKGHACDFACVDGAIPKGEQAEWDSELTKVMEGPCKTWEASGCPSTSPAPAPMCKDDKKVVCVNAHCVMK